MKTVVWFRQDLRLGDNPALSAAAECGVIVPVYVWAPEEEAAFPPGAATKWWLHQSLAALQKSLGGTLILRQGRTLDCLRSVVKETGATRVHWNRRYEPAAVERDAMIEAALRQDGVEVHTFNSALLWEPWQVQKSSGGPFKVFTAFYRNCLALGMPPEPTRAPKFKALGATNLRTSSLSAIGVELSSLRLEPTVDWAAGMRSAWQPGETGANAQLKRMLASRVEKYKQDRGRPDRAGTSRLSPHLHFGEISPRQVWHAIQSRYSSLRTQGQAEPFLRQLIWRDFAHHLLVHFPQTATEPLRPEFIHFPWRNNAKMLRAWQRGRTGYPIVDAGMRELWSTGWMHNRVRMIVASFLVKHLRLHWEEGAYWFWDTLVDADLANNTLGWQWSAGCGADAAPYFRIFNPILQGAKFDPDGAYVRRWVPELANLPNRWIHQPWNMPAPERRQIGLRLGRTYPKPIVDHATARQEALNAFRSLKTARLKFSWNATSQNAVSG
jgi:deoxyribodipyrimidine photo-lyase